MASAGRFLSTLRSSTTSSVNGARQVPFPAGRGGGASPGRLWPHAGGALLPSSLSPAPSLNAGLDARAFVFGSGCTASWSPFPGGGAPPAAPPASPPAPPAAPPGAPPSSSERALVSQLLGQIKRTAEVRQYLKVSVKEGDRSS